MKESSRAFGCTAYSGNVSSVVQNTVDNEHQHAKNITINTSFESVPKLCKCRKPHHILHQAAITINVCFP